MNPTSSSATESAQTVLKVQGMSCGNCARKVTSAAQSVSGVLGVEVSVETQRATIRWSSSHPDVESLIRVVTQAGYGAKVVEAEKPGAETQQSGWQAGLWVGVLCTLPMLIGEWGFRLGSETWFKWASFALAGVVQVIAGARFYRGAWLQFKARTSNMDTLVSIGSTTAFVYSVWALLAGWPGHAYFMEAAAIITLVSVGHWMEARVGAKAAGSLKALMSLTPQMARRREAEGIEQDVPVADLQVEDLILLRPGDTVPTDGRVEEGVSSIDESMLTGESLPIDKVPGGILYAGTTNLTGKLTVRVTATGEGTALARIIAAVRRAQTSSANIQRIGDRVSSIFVPIVLVVALIAALWWGLAYEQALKAHEWLAQFLWTMPVPETSLAAAFIIGAAVLIIACPCAMGLATPAAIMAAANVAARRGILIRDGVALEKAGDISAVIFDKTGTLTTGKPTVAATEWIPMTANSGESQWTEQDLTELASAVARHSTHPFSQAIANLKAGRTELSDWTELRGAGVQGTLSLNGRHVSIRLGSLRWLHKAGSRNDSGKEFVDRWSGDGASVIGLAVDQQLVALFAIRDELKPDAALVVKRLEADGASVFMVTGDNAPTALSLAQQAGIKSDRVHAEVRPEEKAEFVKQLQDQRERVAFVGDGINDAPALEQANLGVAVSRASDIAREAADVILLKSDIDAVPEIFGLARATLRTIKQNLFWAFFYNAAAVPLAALGFLSPILCALIMGLSDLVVIGNALRLRAWKSQR